MKLLWDAIGSEFGGRHELYERNYFGNHESIRFETLMVADITGASARYKGFAEQCMAEYNLDGWIAPDMVTYAGRTKYGQGLSETETPVFETQRTATALTLRAGHPCLLGTPSRPPVSQIDPDSAKRVWFTFVTPTVVMP